MRKLHFDKGGKALCGHRAKRLTTERDYVNCGRCVYLLVKQEDKEYLRRQLKDTA